MGRTSHLILVAVLAISSPALFFIGAASAQYPELGFRIIVEPDNVMAQTLYLGVRSGALAGLDQFDVPAPPEAPGTKISVYLTMFDPPPEFPNRWLVDYRTLQDFFRMRIEHWTMVLEDLEIGSEVHLNISLPYDTSVPYRLYMNIEESGEQEIVAPANHVFVVDRTNTIIEWTLLHADEVDIEMSTMGHIKSFYR